MFRFGSELSPCKYFAADRCICIDRKASKRYSWILWYHTILLMWMLLFPFAIQLCHHITKFHHITKCSKLNHKKHLLHRVLLQTCLSENFQIQLTAMVPARKNIIFGKMTTGFIPFSEGWLCSMSWLCPSKSSNGTYEMRSLFALVYFLEQEILFTKGLFVIIAQLVVGFFPRSWE